MPTGQTLNFIGQDRTHTHTYLIISTGDEMKIIRILIKISNIAIPIHDVRYMSVLHI